MSSMLTTHYGFSSDDITMLHDETSEPVLLPTKANILHALQALVDSSTQCEEIWFHYSGHGATVSEYNGSAIIPLDYETEGPITDMDLYAIIQNIHPSCKAMILMDSCNSGSMCDLEWNYEYLYGLNFMRTQINSKQIANPHIHMISASKRNQVSAEVFDPTTQAFEGVFTDAVLNVLQESSYSITLGKLMQDICTWLVRRGIAEQKPILSSSSENPEWLFVPSA